MIAYKIIQTNFIHKLLNLTRWRTDQYWTTESIYSFAIDI